MDPRNGAIDLRTAGQLPLTSIECWPLVDIAPVAGAIPGIGGELVLRVVDKMTGRTLLIPYDREPARKLAANITNTVELVELEADK